jgi:hypothetical protein
MVSVVVVSRATAHNDTVKPLKSIAREEWPITKITNKNGDHHHHHSHSHNHNHLPGMRSPPPSPPPPPRYHRHHALGVSSHSREDGTRMDRDDTPHRDGACEMQVRDGHCHDVACAVSVCSDACCRVHHLHHSTCSAVDMLACECLCAVMSAAG